MMKKIFLFVLLASLSAGLFAQPAPVHLIPQPVQIELLKGSFILSKSAVIAFEGAEAQPIGAMLAKRLQTPTGFALPVQAGKTGIIQLSLNAATDSRLGDEGYTLEVNPKRILLTANKPAGLFYGMQTLLQLFPKEIESAAVTNMAWTVPAVKILDYPRFKWRGVMLDVSRHFFTKEEVMQYIDQLVRYKYNTFHWHLTDDHGWRVEVKSLPKLTEVGAWRVARAGRFGERAAPKPGEPATYGGFYTHEDIREVVRYAQERFVTIVPEIDVPGHSMAAIAAYPELSCTKDPNVRVDPGSRFSEWYGNGTFKMLIDNTLNPSDEKVYEFLDKVFTEVAALFPGQYIHAGGDECYKGYWAQDPGCQALMKKLGIRHVEDLQGYFMERVEKILNAKGKKLIGWDEILEGGISPGASVMSWRGLKGGIEAAQMGHDVVMSPTTFAYLDYNQGDQTVDPPIYAGLRVSQCYRLEPVPDGVDPQRILGGQGNLWTEQVETLRHAEYMTFPRAWALSEVFWSPKEVKNWEQFARKMEAFFERSDLAQVNYSRAAYDAIIKTRMQNGKWLLELSTEIPELEIRYTIDGAMPGRYSPKYTGPVTMPDGPVTLRVQTFRNDQPMGHLITLKRDEWERRR